MADIMVSTIDNPYNPFTHFDEWKAWDEQSGYFTCSFLARLVQSSDHLSEADQALAETSAVEEMVRENVSGVYIMVTPDTVAPRVRKSA